MNCNEKAIRDRLKNCRILIIEDDQDLAPRLADLYASWGIKKTNMTHRRCVRGHKYGGLDLLCAKPDSFDLICVDIMLPWDERNLKKCDDLQQQWNKLQAKVSSLRDRGLVSGTEMGKLRSDLSTIARNMRKTINREAGVKMIIEWCTKMKKKLSETWTPSAAILFLTARQESSLPTENKKIQEFLGEHSRVKWITKPALELQVVTGAAELLAQE